MFYQEDSLVEKIKGNGIIPVKCRYNIEKNEIILEDIDALIEFALVNKSTHIFYQYFFLSIEDYKIDQNLLEEEKEKLGDIYKKMLKDISSQNKKIRLLNFDEPSKIVAFCLHQGALILIHKTADWAFGLSDAESALKDIKAKYAEQIEQHKYNVKIEQQKHKEEQKIKLENLLLQNKDFAACTNQKSRRFFMKEFFSEEKNTEYKILFMENDFFTIGDASVFADSIYQKIKDQTK